MYGENMNGLDTGNESIIWRETFDKLGAYKKLMLD